MRLRMWGLPVVRYLHLSGPDDRPARRAAPATASERLTNGGHESDPDGPPVRQAADEPPVVAGRLDVPPEMRPWDAVEVPPRDPAPRPARRPLTVPHCDGRHGIGDPKDLHAHACDWCEVLTELIALAKELERSLVITNRRIDGLERGAADSARRIGELERQVADRDVRLAELERQVAALVSLAEQRADYEREMRERS